MRREVKSAKLHTSYFPVGYGNMDVTLGGDKYTGLKMWMTDVCLECSVPSKTKVGTTIYFGIPLANVSGVTFVGEDAPAPIVKAK